jgi:chemotaxis protein MotB
MSDEPAQEIIIVRRRVEGEEGHHGGAWKIAYADFVTAMMAFFLVLWILNATNKDSQTIIARYFNPVKMEDFAKAKKGIRDQQDKEAKPGANEGQPEKSPPDGPGQGKEEMRGKDPNADPDAKAPMNDETLFKNPYAALDQIAGKAPTPREGMAGASPGDQGALDGFNDPFRSAGVEAETDEAAARADEQAEARPPAPAASTTPAPPSNQATPAAPAAGSAPANPQAKAIEAKALEAKPAEAKAVDAKVVEAARASSLKTEIAREGKAVAGANGPQVEVSATDEGLLISLTDKENFGMFEIGSSSPNPKLVHLMERLAKALASQPGSIVLRGYTDARRYHNGSSDNWRLSASRAQMAFYMLVRGGLPESRVERIEGYADRKLQDPQHPDAAENRRIEILLRKPSP